MGEFRSVAWPFQVKTNGDVMLATREQAIFSRIKACLKTRRFIDLDEPGERAMRPGAYGLVPTAMFQIFDYDVFIPAFKQWIVDSLSTLIDSNVIAVNDISMVPMLTAKGYTGLHVRIFYTVVASGKQDVYSTELTTMKATEIEQGW